MPGHLEPGAPPNALTLMANVPNNYDGYCRIIDRERVQEWVRRHCFKEAAEAEDEVEAE